MIKNFHGDIPKITAGSIRVKDIRQDKQKSSAILVENVLFLQIANRAIFHIKIWRALLSDSVFSKRRYRTRSKIRNSVLELNYVTRERERGKREGEREKEMERKRDSEREKEKV